ncbi:PTS sugar transporter subunit IIA [Propionibacterium australiense]|uniref:PTS sugar transporter subunit IIA n=1 Tax=Propionibacterium australiense TaxID=119981 RepID=A0A383S832_9ACTN|nr:PTS sugar transporter subunit IIA [Propionibacterium australiense]RLP07651.1 PTS sugar transporter subunit IIA [Propionibacterium australiense]RLP08076.1 PTS sugar transporter subunit IIA [Propionibacterium australiense]SYZ33722.1 Phosphoenolpyruvate-dependent sugar phosphotransferase system, EIIA 2 [Propionibacterium australiense]VEH92819.1 Multiphosphoryl transfer protein 1 [Propionibacterium australiense]
MSILIDPRYVFTGLDAETRQDVFDQLGGALLADGRVKDDYITALTEREDGYPTGLPVSGGVAIPHTDASHVNQDTIVIATLARPVTFHEMGGDADHEVEVSTVFMLALASAGEHLKVLQKIVTSIQRPEFLETIRSTTDPQVIVDTASEAFGLDV